MGQDTINVFVRVRPQSKAEVDNNSKNIIRMKGNIVDIVSSSAGSTMRFTYDNAFWSCNTFLPGNQNENCTQEDLYTAIGAPLAEHAFGGFNSALIAYGQTGAGKTYSMFGTEKEDGIIPRLGKQIFTNAKQAQKNGWEVVVECSFMEIYNEEVRCLLNPNPKGFNEPMPLRVREHRKSGYFVQGLTNLVINSGNDIHMLVLEGNKVRTISPNARNVNHSHSHSIFTIHIIQTKVGDTTLSRRSKINLVDLGGSEFGDESNDSHDPVGNSINRSLTTLNRVMSCLATGKGNVPYHDSIITSILKDSLSVNSKTSILACISPAATQYDKTVSTLQFAEKAKSIPICAQKNESNLSDTAAEMQKEIAGLKEKLKASCQGTKERENASLDLELSEDVSSSLLMSAQERRDRSKRLMVEREQNTDALCRMLEEQNGGGIDLRTHNLAKDKKILDILASINGMNDAAKILKAREEIAALEASEGPSPLKMKEEKDDDFNQNAGSSENKAATTASALPENFVSSTNIDDTLDDLLLGDDDEMDDLSIDMDDLEGFEDDLEDEIEIDDDDIDMDDLEATINVDEAADSDEIDIEIDAEDEAACSTEPALKEGATQSPVLQVEVKDVDITAEILVAKCTSEVKTTQPKSININSHELQHNRYLKEPFRVCKIDESALLSTRKDRIWEIDVLANKFRNLDANGQESFSLSGNNLYRVEKNPVINTRLTLYFFDASHPYVLSFATTDRRQRFYEIAILLRRNSIMWCPSLVLDGDVETTVKVIGTTIDRHNGRIIKVSGKADFNVAKMPYEVLDLWYGCLCLENKLLPKSQTVLHSFMPRSVHDLYVIGITDVPSKYMGTTVISNYFLNYLDPKLFFVLTSTAASPQDRKKHVNNIFIAICRRPYIVRVSNIEAMDLNSVKKEGLSSNEFSAVACSLQINESTIGFILVNATTRVLDPSVRAAAIRGLMSNFPFGNLSIDIGVRFDNFIVSGAFGFGEDFTGNDMLIKQINVGNIMSDMQEETAPSTITARHNPMRVFHMARPRICRMDVKSYQSSRALDGNNVSANIDIFCQRPFLSTFGCKIKRSKFFFQKFVIAGQRIPSVDNPEIQLSADWIDGTPIRCALTKNEEIYELSDKGCPFVPICICAPDFLRLQHVGFTIFGQLSTMKEKKKISVASGALPLKNVVTLGESVEFSFPLYYRGCTVGTMQGELLHVFQGALPSDYEAAGVSDTTPNVHVVTCFENQMLQNNNWVPSTMEGGKACEWSGLIELDSEMRRESFQLPDKIKKKWKWITQWRTDTADDGWGYGLTIRNSVGKMMREHKFRRRRWIRAMQAGDPMILHNYLKDL